MELKELWVYPVKSCKGIAVPAAVVTPTGEPPPTLLVTER